MMVNRPSLTGSYWPTPALNEIVFLAGCPTAFDQSSYLPIFVSEAGVTVPAPVRRQMTILWDRLLLKKQVFAQSKM